MGPASDKQPQRGLFRLLALLGYPILIALALWLEQPALRALGLPLLAIALVGPWPGHWPGRTVLLVSLILAALVVAYPALALWPPGLICLAVAGWFGLSLRPGQQPLIERFARLIQARLGGSLPNDSAAWLRGWTWVWALLMLALGSVALLLAGLEMTHWWLLWVSIGIPGLVLATLLAEYQLRQQRFPEHEHGSLVQFLMLMSRIRPEHLA